MNDQAYPLDGKSIGWKTKLTSLLASLVIVPSIINSIGDIWVSMNDLPIGEREVINSTLFRLHWRENPVHSKQIIVDVKNVSVPITIDVYRNGDIFLDYGNTTQWFPFDDKSLVFADINFNVISSAYAVNIKNIMKKIVTQPSAPVEIINEKVNNSEIKRSKVHQDGTIENQVIDINTGQTKSYEVIELELPKDDPNEKPKIIEIIKIPERINEAVEVIEIHNGKEVKTDGEGRKPKINTAK